MSPDASVAEILDTMDYGPAPESAGEAEAWLKRHGQQLRLFIDGRWTDPKTRQWFDAINPATGQKIARVAQAGATDVDAAVAAAKKALPGWRDLGGHGRARHLYALARLIQRHARLLAVLETTDNGKPIRETRDIDIPLVARHFYHHAGWAQLIDDDPELRDYDPVGVCGQIIPWNFPLLMLSWKIAPALACGNTVVLKPAEFTSFTALQFAELTREAGLPPGVVNIVTGDGETGKRIVDHPEIAKIAFTGSTEVGRAIREATAGTGKKLTLELGGKSPFIVFDDADLDSAVEGVVDAIWFNQGQVCCAGSRLLVQEGVADRVVAKLKARMETLRMGDPLDKAVDLGAIVAPVQLRRIRELVETGRAEGSEIWQPSWAAPQEGCFYPPTLCTNVEPASTLAQVEIFGPVLAAMTFRTPDEAVALANDTPYGLAASVWTESVNLALDVAPQLQCGVVWVNSTNLFDAAAGFGGYRESGFGREGGREGLFEYLKPAWEAKAKAWAEPKHPAGEPDFAPPADGLPGVDRTAKLYIGGKQARPDGGYSRPVLDPHGRLVGEVGDGNRKDIRNAVEAARKAAAWSKTTGHARAQILYYVAENLAARGEEFAERLRALTGASKKAAAAEVEASVRRLFSWAAWADKHDGAVKPVPVRGVAVAMNEPIGVIGLACPTEAPLLGFVSMVAPAVAMANRVVAVPSQAHPLAATDLYQVLDTSDMPAGVVNIVTGGRDALARVLADHLGVDALWYVGPAEGAAMVEKASAGNLKRVWTNAGKAIDWHDRTQGEGRDWLRRATQVKTVWVPYGE